MRTVLTILESDGNWYTKNVYNSASFDERLDEQLDTGEVQIVKAPNQSTIDSFRTPGTPFDDFCMVRMQWLDVYGNSKRQYFYGFDTVEQRGTDYYIHTLELCEPTRRLMGILIDGRKVTQPTDGSEKKSLFAVLRELLYVALLQGFSGADMMFSVDEDSQTMLEAVTSPEFHWEAETTLWECLCDIGNVVNCMPRLIPATINPTDFNRITFDKINDITGEYEL